MPGWPGSAASACSGCRPGCAWHISAWCRPVTSRPMRSTDAPAVWASASMPRSPSCRLAGCGSACVDRTITWRSASPAPARGSPTPQPIAGWAVSWRSALRFSIVALLLLTAPAHAFQEASQFFGGVPGSATFGASGEGVYFTGAPRFASQTCASCHTAGPQAVGLRLNSDKTDLFAVGYTPGAVYQLQVEIVDE